MVVIYTYNAHLDTLNCLAVEQAFSGFLHAKPRQKT